MAVAPGQRQALAEAGSPYFAEPCGTSAPVGTLPRCTLFNITGEAVPSACADTDGATCFLVYAGTAPDGLPATFYVANNQCGGDPAAPPLLGAADAVECAAPPA